MIFKHFQEELKARALKQSQSGNFDTRIKRMLNMSFNYVANTENEGRWMQKFMARHLLTTTADQNWLVLPLDFDSINKLWHEEYTSEEPIAVVPEEIFRNAYKNTSTQTLPKYAMIKPGTNVLAQPASATTVTLVSSDTGDVTQNITIFGISDGYPFSETQKLNGTSTVTTTATFTRIDKVTKDESTIGTITGSSGGTTYFVLPAGLLSSSLDYYRLYFHPYPTSATSLYMDYFRKQYWLENDYDTHILGDEFDNVILLYAEWILNGEDKRFIQYERDVKKLKAKYNYTAGASYNYDINETSSYGPPFNYNDGDYPRQSW